MKKYIIFDLLRSLLVGLGFVFLISPLLLYWWIHGDYQRYLWIIRGPSPYSQFGSGPFQLYLFIALIMIGLVLFALSLFFRKLSIQKY
jgi:hypothetical protein